jgi:serine O-acetyltransferase
MTVVGIPGRVVKEERRRFGPDGRINLEHHLIPDPVGDAISVLIDRIDFLEARLAHMQSKASEAGHDKTLRHGETFS